MKKIYSLNCIVFSFLFIYTISSQHTTRLMGLTSSGGSSNIGTIYQYDLGSQTHTVNYNNSAIKGKSSLYRLAEGLNGKLYGVTSSGGVYDGGVIYEVNPVTDTYTPKYEHGANLTTDGYGFTSELLLYNNEFYGTSSFGPNSVSFAATSYGAGVIFKWNPTTNVYTKLANFDSLVGGLPIGGLKLYNNKMYGVTNFGGLTSNGTIYEFDPSNNLIAKKYDFATNNLSTPSGSLFFHGNSFFGACNKGGLNNLGVIYEWDPLNNNFNVRANFDISGGNFIQGSFTEFNTKLYVLTASGGALGSGTLIEFNPSNFNAIKQIDFGGSNGASPFGDLLVYNNELFGTTRLNGANSAGTLFKYNVTTTLYTKLHDFNGLNGDSPYSNLNLQNNKFYGSTLLGGSANAGVVYTFNPSNNLVTKIEDLNGSDGNTGIGSLISFNNKFYGIDSLGGQFNKGVLYAFDIQTGEFNDLHSFNGANGERPNGELTVANAKLYGTTKSGGANGIGILYDFDPSNNTFTKHYDFVLAIGSTPVGRLSEFGGKLYGCARLGGGVGNRGSIFEYNLTTNVVANKINLSVPNGVNPNSGMVLFSNNKFYGTTENGGSGGGVSGVLFEYNPNTNGYSAKVQFNSANALGNKPNNELAIYGNKIYGITRNVAANGVGAIYKYDPSLNSAIKLHDFASASTGSIANGLCGVNGKIYGTCMNGGINSNGTLFELDTLTNSVFVKHNFILASGRTPIGGNLITVLNPNYNPVITNIPSVNNGCNNIVGESIFTVNDLDNDTIAFMLSSSNTTLIPNVNLSVIKLAANQYKLLYAPIAGQTGSSNVFVTANDGYGGTDTATISVNVFLAPIVNASASTDTICSGSPVILNGSGAINYAWNNSVINNTPINPTATTTFIVTGIDANNCSDTAQITILVNPLPTILINTNTDSVCIGDSIILISSGVLNPVWNNGAIEGQSFAPTLSQYYLVSGSDINGCSNSDSVLITVNPLPISPVISANLTNPICVNSSVTLSSTNAGGTITWNGPSGFNAVGNSITVVVDSNTNYTAKETNTFTGCISSQGNYAIVSSACLSLNDHANNNVEITIKPNPASKRIEIKSFSQIQKVIVYNVFGKKILVFEDNKSDLDVSALSSGLYTIECLLNGKSVQNKLIID